MHTKRWTVWLGAVASVVGLVGGCANLLPTIPLDINLGSNANFDVVSGTPTAKTFNTSFTNDSGLQIGNGSIEIDPDVMTVTPDQAKTAQGSLPIPETCGDACDEAGVDEAQCNSVCNLGMVVVRIWVGLADEADPMATGDEYGPYVVTLDGTASPISVDPPTVDLKDKTKQAINAGAAKVTVQIISPYTGTITLDSITVNAGL